MHVSSVHRIVLHRSCHLYPVFSSIAIYTSARRRLFCPPLFGLGIGIEGLAEAVPRMELEMESLAQRRAFPL